MTKLSSKLRISLREVAGSSFKAHAIVQQLRPWSAVSSSGDVELPDDISVKSTLITSLEDTVRTLNLQIAQMQAQYYLDRVTVPDAIFTDTEAHEFTLTLAADLKTMSVFAIHNAYDVQFFLPCPSNVRVLVATTLVNHFTELKIESFPLWHTVIATNGAEPSAL